MGSTFSLRHPFPLLVLCSTFTAVSGRAFAQDTQAPAHAAIVDGTVVLDREDGSRPLTRGTPFVPGDRVRTASGRAEFLFPDGSALDLDEYTTIELKSETLLALTSGRVFLNVAGALDPGRAVRYHIDGPAASLQTESAGEYRLSVTDPANGDMELAVLRGSASFFGDTGSMLVRAGELSVARNGYAPSSPQYLNSARMDAFDRWAADRRNERLGSLASNQYLPSDLRSYGTTFDQYGSWSYESSYGYVWYPTVAVGWRPYYNGYWSSVPSYGWTWIGSDPWGWPTHHYGRWGYGQSRWFWIPDRRYSPAYVSWASAPGYVGWCPLGFDNRPVFGLSASVGNTWVGWTVLPQQQFGARGVYVNNAALAPRQVPAANFVSHVAAPYPPPRVPHAPAAASVTTGAAVPRSWSNPPSTLNSTDGSGNSTDASGSSTWYGTVQTGGVRPPNGFRRPNPTPPGQAVAAPFIPSTAPRTLGMPRSPSSTGFSTATPDHPGAIQGSPVPGATSRAIARPGLPGQNPAWSGPSAAAPATPPTTAPPARGPAPTGPARGGRGAPTSGAAVPTSGTASPPSDAASPTGGSVGLRAIPRSAPAPAAPSTAGSSSAGASASAPATAVVRSGGATPARPAGAAASAAPPATTSGQSQGSAAAPPAGARTSHRSR